MAAGVDAASFMVTNNASDITSSFVLPLRTEELSQMYPSSYDTGPMVAGMFQSAPQQFSLVPSYGGNPQYEQHAVHQHPLDPHRLPEPADAGDQFDDSYGLDPLGYSQPPSLPSNPVYPGLVETPAYQAQHGAHTGAILQQLGSGYPAMDDALNMWSTAPSFYGWDDWGPFLNNVGHQGRPRS
ncbi:hypothetical protein OH76DRAFT_1401251 [Lentinus brumalis]|uniref:Uncharacterized protein n=1 Tax=Lentinus brumalis TaxID=2498619 RepID=A0A371DGZ1_9APHY|nr:hypothetical protein OH76DRAFT_1401251 [Polyporus brumalis]